MRNEPKIEARLCYIMRLMKKPVVIAAAVVTGLVVLGMYLYLFPAPWKPAFLRNPVERQVQTQLNASHDPVYLPGTGQTATAGGMTYHNRFTTYSTWQDAYYVQAILKGFYYQVSPRSVISTGNDGPEASIVDFLNNVKNGKVCIATDRQVTDCSFTEAGLGERKFKAYGIDGYTLVAEITQANYSFSGKASLRTFNDSETKQVEQMLTDASPVPLAEARKSQFAYNI